MSLRKCVELYFEEERRAYEASRSLKSFVEAAWPIIEPGTPFVDGWHIGAICEHLSAVSSGQIKDLLINVPPRHAKSSIVSVLWPVWEWLDHPSIKWLFSSYAQSLSTRDSLKSRRLIQSPWFQKHYKERFQLAKDQRAKMRYDNDRAGYRIATSVTGGNTGEGGDRIVCFDYYTNISLKYNTLHIGRLSENKLFMDVWSFNKLKQCAELKPIINFFINESEDWVRIFLTSGARIEVTPDHLIYTGNRQWVKAKDLNGLDRLIDRYKQSHPVRLVESFKEKRACYNIEVEDNNNYYANGFLVHNCDDGNNAAEGESQAVLETTAIWWKEVMSTRKNDPEKSARVVIGQRVSALDVSAVFLQNSDPVHLCLPAEYEGDTRSTVIGWKDPRTELGQLLWPNRFTKPVLENLKKELGTYGTAGQLQQRPTPRGGGIIKEKWFQRFKIVRDIRGMIVRPVFTSIIQSWDTAFKDKQENDFSVCLTFGITAEGFYIINRLKKKLEFPELLRLMVELANIYRPNQVFVEDKASGQSLIQSARKTTKIPLKAIIPQNDKVARCYSISPIIEAGNVYLPEDEEWVQDFIETVTTFPAAIHDDDVDALTQFLIQVGLKNPATTNGMNYKAIMGR